MQLSKKEYARKRIRNVVSMQIETSVTSVTVRHHSASLVMPNSYPRDGIFKQHLTTIKDSYIRLKNKTKLTCRKKVRVGISENLFIFYLIFVC